MSPTSQRRAATAHNARQTFEAHPPGSRVASQRRAARLHNKGASRVASRRRAASSNRAAAGFTLLEMLAVIFLMSIVLFVAINFYLDLSLASKAATDQTRSVRRAVVLLDRVARDLEGAVLLKKPKERDPEAFPWLFIADSESSDAGADRVKFVRRGHHPNAASAAESDLELVSWIITPGADGEGDLELRRASWPQLPESLDRTFPTAENSDLVAAGLASFGIKFQGEDGEWTGRWDSTTLAGSSQLPMVAEIEVSFRTGPGAEDIDGPYRRRVLLPLRPIDLEEQLAAAAAGGPAGANPRDQDGDGKDDETGEPVEPDGENANPDQADSEEGGGPKTVQSCLAAHPELQAQLDANPQVASIIESLKGQPASSLAGNSFIQVPADCL